MEPSPQIDSFVLACVQWLRLAIEVTGAATIGIGALISLWRFVKSLFTQGEADFNAIRLILARYLALALEFQLGADILSTVVAPSWQEIGKLGAIAVIRTGLNYFLSREMKEERRLTEHESGVGRRARGEARASASPIKNVDPEGFEPSSGDGTQ